MPLGDAYRVNRLEGYLYPDTYFLGEDESSESIINKLLRRFDEMYTQEIQQKGAELGLTTDEIIIIASIIEEEIKVQEGKSIATSVVFNRIKNGMKLQMDAILTIEAVVNSADTDYIYYVVEDDTTGEHFYTADYDEFLAKKREYTKKFGE